MPSISKSKTSKIKRDGRKKRILDIVTRNSSLNGSQLTKLCSKNIELSETLVKELIKELVKEKKLNYVETFNNQKHYWLPEKQNLSKSVLFDRQLICGIGFLDERLNWMEKAYPKFKLEEKSGIVRNTIAMLFQSVNNIIISQAFSEGKDTHRKALDEYKKRIRKLLTIIDSDNSSDKEVVLSWFNHILGTYPHDYNLFLKERDALLNMDESNFL